MQNSHSVCTTTRQGRTKTGRKVCPFLSWCFTSTETIMLITDGRMEVGEAGDYIIIYRSLHCHHQNDSCIKVGNDESHFNVSLIVRDKVIRQCRCTDLLFLFLRRAKRESSRGPPAYGPNALPLRLSSQVKEVFISISCSYYYLTYTSAFHIHGRRFTDFHSFSSTHSSSD